MATDENNHKNEARDDWTGCTFRVERGPSSEGRAWGMADILLRVRTVLFRAVMFLLHCYPHIVLLLTPRVVSSFPQRS